MPHMRGIDFLTQLRSNGNPVKLGFITSQGTDQMRRVAEGVGAEFFLTKPFAPEAFKSVLGEILS